MLWLAVNVTDRELSEDVSPSLTSEAVIAMVGAVLYVQLNCVAAVLSTLVEASVKAVSYTYLTLPTKA